MIVNQGGGHQRYSSAKANTWSFEKKFVKSLMWNINIFYRKPNALKSDEQEVEIWVVVFENLAVRDRIYYEKFNQNEFLKELTWKYCRITLCCLFVKILFLLWTRFRNSSLSTKPSLFPSALMTIENGKEEMKIIKIM